MKRKERREDGLRKRKRRRRRKALRVEFLFQFHGIRNQTEYCDKSQVKKLDKGKASQTKEGKEKL